MRATPAARDILDAVEVLRDLNADNARKVPNDAPAGFVKKRWEDLVFTEAGVDRRFYELCALSELKNALRSGDIWVQGSRQFKDFDEYLLPTEKFVALQQAGHLPLAVVTDCDRYLHDPCTRWNSNWKPSTAWPRPNELPDAIITESGLKITALTNAVPETAEALMQQAYALLPHVKITELLMEVDEWTGFTRHFTHIKNGEAAKDKTLLLTAVIWPTRWRAPARPTPNCPGCRHGTSAMKPIRRHLAELVNAHLRHPFAVWWGDGTTSSSDGQRFKAGGRAEAAGHINPKYGSDTRRAVLHAYFRPIRAVPHEGHQCRRTRCHLCAVRLALS